eukprot:scaffold158_cov388-Prasinococcus_capsulatus_cf.AAC.6
MSEQGSHWTQDVGGAGCGALWSPNCGGAHNRARRVENVPRSTDPPDGSLQGRLPEWTWPAEDVPSPVDLCIYYNTTECVGVGS